MSPTVLRAKPKEHKRVGKTVYNSKRWKYLRRHKLHFDPLCEQCGVIATDVHHKHGVVADPWALDGLEALCHSCHSKVTRAEQVANA